jgi:hypothetical protein
MPSLHDREDLTLEVFDDGEVKVFVAAAAAEATRQWLEALDDYSVVARVTPPVIFYLRAKPHVLKGDGDAQSA